MLRTRRWRGRIGLRAAYSTSSLSLFQRSLPILLASPFPNTTLSAMLKTPAGRVFLSFLTHPLHCPSRGLDVFLALIMAAQKEISLAKWLFASYRGQVEGPLIHQFTFFVETFRVKLFHSYKWRQLTSLHTAGSHGKLCSNPSTSRTYSPREEATSPCPKLSQRQVEVEAFERTPFYLLPIRQLQTTTTYFFNALT